MSEDVAALVRRCVQPGLPHSVWQQLFTASRTLLRENIPADVLEEALQEWDNRPGLAPGMLPHLVSDVVRRRKSAVREEAHVAYLRGWEARLEREMSAGA